MRHPRPVSTRPADEAGAGGTAYRLPRPAALTWLPLGYTALAGVLVRYRLTWTGLLLGVGAVLYTAGGLAIFALGATSPWVQVLEILGAAPFAAGFVLLGRAGAGHGPDRPRTLRGRTRDERAR